MLALTHVIVTLLVIQLLMLDRNEAFIALTFGVFIDLDHLLGLGTYAKANGIAPLMDMDTLMNPGGQWKSMLHSPMALAMVAPISYVVRMAIPVLFWGVHVSMDYLEESFLGHFSNLEAMLGALAAIALVTMRYSKYVESFSFSDIRTYLKMEVSSVRAHLRLDPQAAF
ncbi:MAG: hypothetical protein MUC90_02605 [Thermoplasmata archaeon]|jgi:hypothetical protein|nr:hypothetical protein [Thermoplasmata archaeon]